MYILHKVSIWINCLTVRTESSFESPLTPPRVGQILSSPTSLLLHFFDIDRVEGNKYETLKRGTWKVTSGGKDKRIDNVERKINHCVEACVYTYCLDEKLKQNGRVPSIFSWSKKVGSSSFLPFQRGLILDERNEARGRRKENESSSRRKKIQNDSERFGPKRVSFRREIRNL